MYNAATVVHSEANITTTLFPSLYTTTSGTKLSTKLSTKLFTNNDKEDECGCVKVIVSITANALTKKYRVLLL
jgi:hypothetical protein